ncbi:hypothetical protein KFL_007080025 [Klebsormidium nitens]|uniref:Uncharacterized protein n=1 Tax=Klebsormidium nitens TaxID=105231 RepID=A0A1Y1IJK8_KLENI|nr:hypothetical protein KFL_007080025 [Klebsormidium nitens]|eukprot:GAQ90964.1 hypothetical protein KFL_007080025 [Klebsormidium nitens]
MARTFALERLPFCAPSGHAVWAEWQTGYFDINSGCSGADGSKHLSWKAFRRFVPEEATAEGHPLFEPARNGKIVLCAPQLFLRWAQHAGVSEEAAFAISKQLLEAHAKHLVDLELAAFYKMDRLNWLRSLTIGAGDISHYEAMSNWTKNARALDGAVMAYCSIPVRPQASAVPWLLTELIRPDTREAFAQHVRVSGRLLWEELVGDEHHFLNVRCDDMMALVCSYSGPGALLLQAIFFNAKMLELSSFGLYPPAPTKAKAVTPFPTQLELSPQGVIRSLLDRADPFPVGWRDALMVIGGQNASLFRTSFAKRVRANCSEAEYREDKDKGDVFTTINGLKSLCRSCRGDKRRALLEVFDSLERAEDVSEWTRQEALMTRHIARYMYCLTTPDLERLEVYNRIFGERCYRFEDVLAAGMLRYGRRPYVERLLRRPARLLMKDEKFAIRWAKARHLRQQLAVPGIALDDGSLWEYAKEYTRTDAGMNELKRRIHLHHWFAGVVEPVGEQEELRVKHLQKAYAFTGDKKLIQEANRIFADEFLLDY